MLVFSVALAAPLHAMAATVTVTPDRTEVFENESFNVDFVYSDEVRDQPGFDVLLEDFQIIANTRSSNLLSVNGRFSYEHSYSLTLMPRRTGALVIPPIRFDDIESRPVRITVKPAPAGDQLQSLGDLFLEVEFGPEEGYVQGQYILTQRLYHRGWLAGGKLSPPQFNNDAVKLEVDQAKRYTMYREGERYQIYEQSYLIFPQSSGTLTAEAMDFTGQLREPGRPPRLKRVSAAAVSVDVLGVPNGVASDEFLPASRLTLEEEWPTNATFEVGQPVTRTIRVTVDGQMAAQLREIDIPEVEGLRVYADQPKREDVIVQSGVTGTVEQSLALVPQREGSLTLPAIRVGWWDAKARAARVAELPARTLDVAAATVGAPNVVTAAPGPVNAATPDAAPLPARSEDSAPAEASPGWPYWPLLTVLMGLLWVGTLGAWGLDTHRRRAADAPSRRGP
ncbi:MAG: BatD family protein, partial [Pseudomonadota bacterium]